MPDYKYLIVGGGMTAHAALQGIRQVDSNGSVGLIGSEGYAPYDRPPLSKGLWKGKPLEKIWRSLDGLGAELHLGRTVQTLNPHSKQVQDDQGTLYRYEKLLLATGGTPHRLPFGGEHVIYFRTLDDYQKLRQLTEQGQRFAVIGGGFIGSEIAAALATQGKQVVMIFPEKGIGGRIYPEDLSNFLNDYYRQKGVEVMADQLVTGLEQRGSQFALKTGGKQETIVDGVVGGIGIRPNIELATIAGLQVENGIVVNQSLQTSNASIYAAGDVAAFYNPALGVRLRVEHEDNAKTMGKMAGQAMAGERVSYDHLPLFYSDLFDLGYEAVGDLDSGLETVSDWVEPYQKGVVYYLRNARVVGVLLWNVWDKVDTARALIAHPGPFDATSLKGKITG